MLAIAIVGAVLWWWQRSRDEHGEAAVADAAVVDAPGGAARPYDRDDDDAPPVDLRARPWLRTQGSIAGFVRDESGHGIAGAQVCARLSGPRLPSEMTLEPRCSTSGASGAYVIDALPPVRLGVSAQAPSYRPGAWRPADRQRDYLTLAPGEARAGIDIVLRSGAVEIHGIVKDLAGGVIEGALVTSSGRWWGGGDEGAAFTHSDDEGRFSMWVAPGDHVLVASADGYAEGNRSGVAPGFTFELRLSPESVLAGRVVDGAGKPVADVTVTAEGEGWDPSQALTDEDGRFRLARLEPGRYKPFARHDHGIGQVAQSVLLGVGETRDDLEITLHPAVAIRGHVMIAGESPTPCEHGSVSLKGEQPSNTARAETAPDGDVELIGLLPDTYHVEVHCDGKLARPKYDDIVVADVTSDGHVWEVDAGQRLLGRVLDDSGAPVHGASLWAAPAGVAGRGQQTYAAALADPSDGTFELAGLLPGEYDVHASAEGFIDQEPPPRATIPATGDAEITITLRHGGVIEGRVIDEHGQPVAHADVRASGTGWHRSSTDDDGHFRLDAIEAGEHRVTASEGWSMQMRAPGSSDDDIQGERVQVRDGEVVSVELHVESQSGRIRGRVVDGDGGPVDDAFITSIRESDSAAKASGRDRERARWGSWSRPPVLTDGSGEFTLEQLAAGQHTIVAMRKGGGEGVIEHVEVGRTGVVVTIAEGGRIAGNVALTGGGHPARFSISADDSAQGISRSESFFESGGAWAIEDLPPGNYDVRASADDGTTQTTVKLAAGEVKAGVALELTPRIDVSGTVVDLDSGEPVPGMSVVIAPRMGEFMFNLGDGGDKANITDDAGAFTVERAPAGKVRVMVLPRNFAGGAAYGWSTIATQIPGDQKRYVLPPLRVVKQRVPRGGRSGDLGFELAESNRDEPDEDRRLLVAVVRPGGPAATAGLKLGDEVVEVAGHEVRGVDSYRFEDLTSVPQGERVTLELADGRSVTIVAGPPI